jgi:predicted unusual protein kinase regulating ubiquinone biosynthesis (AarF/ABC1/UbiB family)
MYKSFKIVAKQNVKNYHAFRHKSPVQIWKFVAQFQWRNTFQKNRKEFGIWMKEEMISLGPAFIKIGQFMSTRIDIFGKEITDELSKLQDRIEPVPFEYIDMVLREELGDKYQEFEYINPNALATASIGQVHRGTLKNNTEIVVKVQKPNIAQEIRQDLKVLNDINELLLKLGSVQAKEMDMILKQYDQFLSNELNYSKELHQMAKFRSTMPDLPMYVPKPYKALSTSKVLTMEFVDSLKITDVTEMKRQKIHTTEIAAQLIEIFLSQIINYGMVHCDPHPGNIGIGADGNIVLYDFGNVVTLSPDFRKNVNNLVFAIYQKDIDEFVEILLRMNILELEDTFEMLELKSFFHYFFNYLETLDFNKLKDSIINREVFNGTNIKVKINQDFLSLFRVFSLIDGTCSALDPKFNYITALTPFTEELFKDIGFIDTRIRKDIVKLSSYPKLLQNTDQNLIRLNKRVSKMADNTYAFRGIFILLAVIDNIAEPEKLIFVIPPLLYVLFKMEF